VATALVFWYIVCLSLRQLGFLVNLEHLNDIVGDGGGIPGQSLFVTIGLLCVPLKPTPRYSAFAIVESLVLTD